MPITRKHARFDRETNSTADREKAKERAAELAKRYISKPVGGTKSHQEPSVKAEPVLAAPAIPDPTNTWSGLSTGTSGLQYFSRTGADKQVALQPWAAALSNALLEAAETGGTILCLIWPLRLSAIELLHAIASAERNFAKDLRGLRTLLYPGTTTSRNRLDTLLVDRERYSQLSREIWVNSSKGVQLSCKRESKSVLAVLNALNNIHIHHPEVANSSLSELIPTFIFDNDTRQWGTVVEAPLERTLRKVPDPSYRRTLRSDVRDEWGVLSKAPGAMLVLRPGSRKEHWGAALKDRGLRGDCKPDVFLLDATTTGDAQRQKAVIRIPEFLKFTHELGLNKIGSVVITDDPKTYFLTAARLNSAGISADRRVFPAEAEDALFSATPKPADWVPELKSNHHFNVGIVDKDASTVAMAFHRLAQAAGSEDSLGHREMLNACLYLLRLSGTPAGYMDLDAALTQSIEETGSVEYGARQSNWSSVETAINVALAAGALSTERSDVDTALARARKLVTDWTNATPMALRLLEEVKRHTLESSGHITLVLPSSWYVSLTHRFLRRQLCEYWGSAELRIRFQTQSALKHELSSTLEKPSHYVFVGLSPDVLRMLMSREDIPHGTVVLAAYKQAESTLQLLTGMKAIAEFKPYRGRMGLLMQELEKRLKQVQNPPHVERLGDFSLNFSLDDLVRPGTSSEQHYTRFDLDGGGHSYSSGSVYRYDANDDPVFQRVTAEKINSGDFIFEMSEELRTRMEEVLGLKSDGTGSVVLPQRMFLKLYRQDVGRRCEMLYGQLNQRELSRQIQASMKKLDPDAENCRASRIHYWLAVSEDDTTPHAPRDAKYFRLFCSVLGIGEQEANNYWNYVRNARSLNQHLGRTLAAQYAEILFHPESAITYRKIPLETITRLQQDAMNCVFRVEKVTPPEANS
ncbi:MAG: hypothetical protein HY847_09780 [Betaproteobacteria bacterium]|nr:hypothetical protein [Betaproteobacteria bacterium]